MRSTVQVTVSFEHPWGPLVRAMTSSAPPPEPCLPPSGVCVDESVLERHRVEVAGRTGGPAMVFVHGFGADRSVWRHVMPAFASSHRLVAFDHLDAAPGTRQESPEPPTLQGYADDVLAICVALGLREVVLVGHAAGATISLLAARADPDRFTALVLLGPAACYLDGEGYVGGYTRERIEAVLAALQDDPAGWADDLGRYALAQVPRSVVREESFDRFREADPSVLRAALSTILFADHRPELAEVRTPTLVLHASDEPLTPLAQGEYVHQQIPGSELLILEGAGHLPQLSTPAAVVAAIHGFLAPHEAVAVRASARPELSELEDLYDHAPMGYVVTDVSWQIVRINRTLLEWLGRDRGDLIGKPFTELLSASSRTFHTNHGAPHVHIRGALGEVVLEMVRDDGSLLPVMLTSIRRPSSPGTPARIRTSVADATRRQRYEERLRTARRRSERRMRLLQEVVADLAGAATVPEVAEVLTGALVEAFGATGGRLWLLDRRGRLVDAVSVHGQPPARRPAVGFGVEARALSGVEVAVDPDGRVAAIAARHDGQPIGVLALELEDLALFGADERALLGALGRHAGQALERARLDERKDRLLSVVSHELRTPLTPIVGFSELALLRDPGLSDLTRQALEAINRNGEHLLAVVDDLLELTRARRGAMDPSPALLELGSLVEQLRSDQDLADVEVIRHAEVAFAWADAGQVTQIVANLVSNAVRYGRPPIVIEVANDGPMSSVVVRDDGEGVPSAFVPYLFEEFTQLDDQDHRGTGGLGLGLAIARDLAVANGGTLSYEPAVGPGARFVLRLPVASV